MIVLFENFLLSNNKQDLNWASIQSFRTLCSKVTEVLHNQLSDKDLKNKSIENK